MTETVEQPQESCSIIRSLCHCGLVSLVLSVCFEIPGQARYDSGIKIYSFPANPQTPEWVWRSPLAPETFEQQKISPKQNVLEQFRRIAPSWDLKDPKSSLSPLEDSGWPKCLSCPYRYGISFCWRYRSSPVWQWHQDLFLSRKSSPAFVQCRTRLSHAIGSSLSECRTGIALSVPSWCWTRRTSLSRSDFCNASTLTWSLENVNREGMEWWDHVFELVPIRAKLSVTTTLGRDVVVPWQRVRYSGVHLSHHQCTPFMPCNHERPSETCGFSREDAFRPSLFLDWSAFYRSLKTCFANMPRCPRNLSLPDLRRNMVGRAFSQCFYKNRSVWKIFWKSHLGNASNTWRRSPVESIRMVMSFSIFRRWNTSRFIFSKSQCRKIINFGNNEKYFPASFCNISVSGSNVTRPANASAVTISGLATKRRFLRFHRFVFKVSVKTRHQFILSFWMSTAIPLPNTRSTRITENCCACFSQKYREIHLVSWFRQYGSIRRNHQWRLQNGVLFTCHFHECSIVQYLHKKNWYSFQ